MPLDFTFFTASKEAPAPQNAQEEWANPRLCLQFLPSSLLCPSPLPFPSHPNFAFEGILDSEKLDHVTDVPSFSKAG